MNPNTELKGPLDGLKIVEMVGLGPGPFAAMMLAEMGADVIRVHSKGGRSAFSVADTPFDVMARSRRSIAIDLKQPEGAQLLWSLLDQADAVMEGFRPGVMERRGFGPEQVLARRPAMVYGRMTGWGQFGPLSPYAGHDLNYIALSGGLHAMGRADEPPMPPLNLVGDFGGGGMMLAYGMVCALYEARRSGLGQVVDAAMTDGSALLAAMIWGTRASGEWSAQRADNDLDGGAPYYGCYTCADGKFISIGPLEPQFYAAMIERLGLQDQPELLALLQKQGDRSLWGQQRAALEQVFRSRTRDEWEQRFKDSDACFAPVLDWHDAPQHPHNRARGTFFEAAGVVQPAPAPRLSRTPATVKGLPPTSGQHSDDIMVDWQVPAALQASARAVGAV